MTKKHFIAAAKIVTDYDSQHPGLTEKDRKLAKLHVAIAFCRLFKAENSRFNETRFMTVCGF